jgi:hypothetical protein
MKRILKLATAGVAMMWVASAAQADTALTQSQLQKLFPGTFTAVVHGALTLTFTAKGNGTLIGAMPGKQDSGQWSLRNGKLCVMLTSWTRGKSACSTVVADSGWYRGQGIKFRKI